MKIGLISDTHGYMDDRILRHLASCDEIWHAGDIGNVRILDQLAAIGPVRAVYGNIDGTSIRSQTTEFVHENIDGVKMLMIHIAGSSGKYNAQTRALIDRFRPDLLICGHSHLLKVQRDPRFDLLYMNPGAAGRHGLHKVRTICLFDIQGGEVCNLKVIELGPRSS